MCPADLVTSTEEILNGKFHFLCGDGAGEIIQELFDSRRHKYPVGLQQSMRRSNFIFDYVSGIHYIHHMINFDRGGVYKDYPELISNKRKQQ